MPKIKKQAFSLLNTIKSFDMFGREVIFNIDGEKSVKSYTGSFWTIMMICLTFVYAFTKW